MEQKRAWGLWVFNCHCRYLIERCVWFGFLCRYTGKYFKISYEITAFIMRVRDCATEILKLKKSKCVFIQNDSEEMVSLGYVRLVTGKR